MESVVVEASAGTFTLAASIHFGLASVRTKRPGTISRLRHSYTTRGVLRQRHSDIALKMPRFSARSFLTLLFIKIKLAEREGFEPSKGLLPYTLSRGAPSTTRPSLRVPHEEGGRDHTGEGEAGSKRLPAALLPPGENPKCAAARGRPNPSPRGHPRPTDRHRPTPRA